MLRLSRLTDYVRAVFEVLSGAKTEDDIEAVLMQPGDLVLQILRIFDIIQRMASSKGFITRFGSEDTLLGVQVEHFQVDISTSDCETIVVSFETSERCVGSVPVGGEETS